MDGLIFNEDDLENNFNIVVGDVNGDNFDDIYIINKGKLMILNGIDIEKKIKLDENIDGSDVVVIDVVSFYENYIGEIEIIFGYLLQWFEFEDDIVFIFDFDLFKEVFNIIV